MKAEVGVPLRVRDTPAGRRQIAAEIQRLKAWCVQQEVPWLPTQRAQEPPEVADVR